MAFEITEMEWKDGQELQQQPKKVVAVQGRNSKERYDNTRDDKGMQGGRTVPNVVTVTYQGKGGTSKFYPARDRDNTVSRVKDKVKDAEKVRCLNFRDREAHSSGISLQCSRSRITSAIHDLQT